jgi:excisionase family DNA binding protein
VRWGVSIGLVVGRNICHNFGNIRDYFQKIRGLLALMAAFLLCSSAACHPVSSLGDAMPPPSYPSPRSAAPAAGRWPDVLDVHLTAQLLTVSADTVYDLLQRGDLPGRKVGRKWLTTKTAVLKWLEQSAPPRPTAAQETALARDCPRRYGRAGRGRAYGESAARHEGPARPALRACPE